MMFMFFTKSDTGVIQEKSIKREITDKDGAVLLHINICYPSFILKEKSRLRQSAEPYYEKSAKNFLRFAENDLLERAKKLSQNEGFRPLGAVMKFTNAYENRHLLSVYVEISVFDGESKQNQLRSAQVWNKDRGYIYSFGDILAAGTKEFLLERFASEGNPGCLSAEEYRKSLKTFFCENNFYLTEKAAAFFYPADRVGGRQGGMVLYVDTGVLKDKKMLKISV